MHTIREIARLATMLAGLIVPQLRLCFVSALPQLRLDYASATPQIRLTYALAPISCEHCRSSRNNPHCAPRHVIYYFTTSAWKMRYSAYVEHKQKPNLTWPNRTECEVGCTRARDIEYRYFRYY